MGILRLRRKKLPQNYKKEALEMKLRELLDRVDVTELHADPETEITGVSYDSRDTRPGDLFVADRKSVV